jgi:hypothetical protein
MGAYEYQGIGSAPTIASATGSISICNNSGASFSISATNAKSYQWQVSTGGTFYDIPEGSPYAGINSNNLTINPVNAAMNGYRFRCVVSGVCNPAAISDSAMLSVKLLPIIGTNPASTAVCQGSSASFAITAGNATTYQWQVNTGSGFTDIPNGGSYTGSNTNTLVIHPTVAGMNGYVYRCIASVNGCSPAFSGIGTLTIKTVPTVGSAVSPGSTVCAGTMVTMSGTGASTYSWTGGISNATPFTATATTTYSVTGTAANGCTNTAASTITVNALPTVDATVSPAVTVCAGTPVTLTGNGAIFYSWTGGITNGIPFTPSATSSYTLSGKDANGCVNSSTRVITVNPVPAPAITANGPLTFCAGGSVTLTASAATSTVSYVNRALRLDGIDDYVQILNSSNFQLTGAFSLEAWIKVAAFDKTWQTIIGKGDNSWRLHRYNNTNHIGFGTSGLSNIDLEGTSNVNDGQWHHIAAVYTGSKKLLYVDGNLDASADVTGTLSASFYDIAIGENLQALGRSFNGSINEIRIWNAAKSQAQVLAGKDVIIPFTSEGLLAYYRFDEGAGTTAADLTVNGRTATLINGPGWVSFPATPVQNAINYAWTPAGQTASSITVSTTGTYTATAIDALFGCSATATQVVTVNPLPNISVLLQPAATICAGTPITLSASGAVSYKWSGGITNGMPFTPGATNTYTVTATGANGCNTLASRTITVNPLPNPVITPNGPLAFCRGNSVNLVASNASAPGHALQFDGTDDYVELYNSGYLDISTGEPYDLESYFGGYLYYTHEFTIETWIRVATFDKDWQAIIGKGDGSWRLSRAGNTNYIGFGTSGMSNVNLQGTTNVNDGQWHHIAAVYDGYQKLLYVDGKLDAVADAYGVMSYSFYDIVIGENQQVPGRYFNGSIDEVRIWNVARTQAEIQAGRNTIIAPDTYGLVTYYRFDEGAGASVADLTGKGHTGTLENGPGWVSSPVAQGINYLWGPGGQSSSSIVASTSGNYTVIATDIFSGCSQSTSTTITVNPLPNVSVTTQPSSTVCAGTPVTLSGNGAGSYSWDSGISDGMPFTPANTTTYSVTGTDVHGCTNTASQTITITEATANTTTITTCDSYTWPVNNVTYTASGTYTSVNGCHTEILDLTITKAISNTTTISTCDNYTWPINNVNYTSSGTYTVVNGCHTEILNLTITEASSNTTTISTCDSYAWPVNNVTYTASGTYTAVNGCHTEILDLTITAPTTVTTVVSACISYTWPANGVTYTASGTYTTGTACSAQVLNLTITAAPTWYLDADGDHYYIGAGITQCASPGNGYSATGLLGGNDCNDADALVHSPVTYYQDTDKDGYGTAKTTVVCSSTAPAGYSAKTGDCNDKDAAVYPGAPEVCDGKDNNCNGLADENCQPPLTVSINDVSMAEGNSGKKTMTFTVTLSNAYNNAITINYSTSNGTATAGSDYTATSGSVTFKPGIVSQSINVNIVTDKVPETNETFNVNISTTAQSVQLAKAAGIGTILNDDAATAISSAITLNTTQGSVERSAKISPNPASNIFNLRLNGYSGLVNLQLLNVEGKILAQQKLEMTGRASADAQWNVSTYANGMYMLAITDNEGKTSMQKIWVAH